MTSDNIAKLMVLKIICCGVIVFFLLGGVVLLTGLSTGNMILVGLGGIGFLWAFYKISLIIIGKIKNSLSEKKLNNE